MPTADRRLFLGQLALGMSSLAAAKANAAPLDGHAAGHDAIAASDRMSTVPRKSGDPLTFTASLDRAAIKSTTGGWAREITARQLPLATGIAGAHLFLNAGGIREMHWHTSAEWAYILDGRCQVTVVDPRGITEVANYEAGDLWFFPRGHAHSIQALGDEPCHAVLAFDDGLYSEHGTFGLTDWISRLEPAVLEQALGIPLALAKTIPPGETYIQQGPVIALDGDETSNLSVPVAALSHRYRLMATPPLIDVVGGSLYVASAKEFPMSATMTGMIARLQPGAMHAPHWHPEGNEWHYVAAGNTRVTLFGPDKRLATADLTAGDCAYLPRGCGHMIQNIGDTICEIVGVLDSGSYIEARVTDWLALAPRHALAANLGVPKPALTGLRPPSGSIVAAL